MGGGFLALSLLGGSAEWKECVIGHNFDDLTNVGAELSFAWKQGPPPPFTPKGHLLDSQPASQEREPQIYDSLHC